MHGELILSCRYWSEYDGGYRIKVMDWFVKKVPFQVMQSEIGLT